MKIDALLLVLVTAVVILSGCATLPATTTINVPIPVACTERTPEPPVLPIDGIQAADTLDTKVAAALATIERLRGYVGELVAALTACQQPISLDR